MTGERHRRQPWHSDAMAIEIHPPASVVALMAAAVGARACRVRGRRVGARHDPGPARRRTGISRPTRDRIGCSPCSRARSTRTGSGRSPSTRAARSTRSRPSARTMTTPTSGARTSRVRRRHQARPRPTRLHGQRDRLGRAGADRRPRRGRTPGRRRSSEPGARRSVRRHRGRRRRAGCGRVGEPAARFREDALRMVRAVRLAAVLEFEIDPPTFEAIRANAALAGHVSGERVAAELREAAPGGPPVDRPPPAVRDGPPRRAAPGDRRAARNRAEQGRGRGPVRSHRSHARCRAARTARSCGSPRSCTTSASHRRSTRGRSGATRRSVRRSPSGSWIGSGSRSVATERVVHLVRNHMFTYEPDWGDAGIRRFIQRAAHGFDRRPVRAARGGQRRQRPAGGRERPGRPASARRGGARGLGRARSVAARRARRRPHGGARSCRPARTSGAILDALLDRVIADPKLNDRATLLLLAESMLAEDG